MWKVLRLVFDTYQALSKRQLFSSSPLLGKSCLFSLSFRWFPYPLKFALYSPFSTVLLNAKASEYESLGLS